jgi:cytochrome c-type protein NapC
MENRLPIVFAIGLALGAAAGTAVAAPDWGKVPAKKITVMLPGIASLEWTLNGSDHSGVRGIKKGESCTSCHEEELADIGKKAASGEKFEPKPVKGKAGSIPVNVQAAHDGTNLYLRFQWKQPAASGNKQDQKNQEKVAVMIDAGKVEYGTLGGCWASCHDDLRTMPDVNKDAPKHAKAKELDIRDNGPTKYLKESRSAIETKNKPRGGWDKLKPDAEIEAALKEGKFLEMWQWRQSQAPRAGYVLDARRIKEAQGLADGKCEGGTCTVTFTRKLASGGAGSHAVEPGKTYTLGFAIHDDWANERYHHVSLGYSMAMDNPKADVNIVKQ